MITIYKHTVTTNTIFVMPNGDMYVCMYVCMYALEILDSRSSSNVPFCVSWGQNLGLRIGQNPELRLVQPTSEKQNIQHVAQHKMPPSLTALAFWQSYKMFNIYPICQSLEKA